MQNNLTLEQALQRIEELEKENEKILDALENIKESIQDCRMDLASVENDIDDLY